MLLKLVYQYKRIAEVLKVNLHSDVPIYRQLVSEIQRLIDARELRHGDPLPTIRSFASQLDIAINTVARAYQELEAKGLLTSRGRRGTFVRTDHLNSHEALDKVFKDPIRKLLQSGLSRSEIERIFEKNLSVFFD